ncbi:MAG: hypothetical protein NVSMB56_13980 [Pyrinomonadaceae bacterium]
MNLPHKVAGATMFIFSPNKRINELFPQDILSAKHVTGEYADFSPVAGTKLVQGLAPMDIKWWGRKDD